MELPESIVGQHLERVERRAKYLLFRFGSGSVIVHLGMSGRLRVVEAGTPLQKHDHIDICFEGGRVLRLNDARRFGSVHFSVDPASHWLLSDLGPEPLTEAFSGAYLHRRSRGTRQAVKTFVMDSHVVVGVGNIYANEALFKAGIRPRISARRVTRQRYDRLAACVRQTLEDAIDVGGTTLRDYVGSNGEPGYFGQELDVYGREGELCHACGATLKGIRLGQRATVYCPKCQQ